MFNVSLSDRLKAAVNQLEATGSSLQARAQAGLGPQGFNPNVSGPASSSRPNDPFARSRPGSDAQNAQRGSIRSPDAAGAGAAETSPTRGANYNAASLAEGALSGLKGLRSLHFSRPSLDGIRPQSTGGSRQEGDGAPRENGQAKELKEIPSPNPTGGAFASDLPIVTSSRPSSPARFPGTAFAVGSDPSSLAPTPHPPRSPPGPSGLSLPSRLATSASTTEPHPPPDPNDPATYPLPPSPDPTPSPLLQPASQYGDPLGASPIISPADASDVTGLNMEGGTGLGEDSDVVNGNSEESAGVLGLQVVAEATSPGIATRVLEEAGVTGHRTPQEVEQIDTASSTPGAPHSSTGGAKGASDQTSILQAQILAADTVLRELTPLEGGIADAEALEGWVRMMTGKVEMIGQEMARLQGQIKLQDSRMEELRDTHRLEGTSQSDLISKLRSQLSTAESNLASKAGDLSSLSQLRTDLGKAQTQIKEEEEKRTKAISLLKTVRMKLVKAEKDKEEVEKDRAEERAERSRALDEVERVKAEREREVTRLRQGFEREVQGIRDRAEKEMKEKRAAWELEMITTKAAHAKDMTGKTSHIAGLEAAIKELNTTKDEQFHTIQARHAEAETARGEAEALQNRTKELEFQLREASERITLLEDPSRSLNSRGRNVLREGDRFVSSPSPSPSRQNPSATSASEVQRLLAAAEARAEAKLSDLRFKIRSLEKERNEQEEEFGQKLQERVFELEKVRRVVTEKEGEVLDAQRRVEAETAKIAEEVSKREYVEKQVRGWEARMEEAKEDIATAQEGERMAKNELSQIKLQLQSLNSQVEEQKQLVQTLRNANKTLRDELRKVQSSVQLMEKSRNPGVGYWSSANNHGSNSTSGAGSAAEAAGAASSGRSGGSTPGIESRRRLDSGSERKAADGGGANSVSSAAKGPNEEEEVNLEYLRNVILQFLENPHMRRQLVQVLSVILHFTPQELRRLNAKVTAV